MDEDKYGSEISFYRNSREVFLKLDQQSHRVRKVWRADNGWTWIGLKTEYRSNSDQSGDTVEDRIWYGIIDRYKTKLDYFSEAELKRRQDVRQLADRELLDLPENLGELTIDLH